MTTFDIFLTYLGDVILALTFLYGFKNYLLTFIAGFVAFFVFYFSFAIKNPDWEISIVLNALKNAAIIHVISCIIAIVIYKLLPVKETPETSGQ